MKTIALVKDIAVGAFTYDGIVNGIAALAFGLPISTVFTLPVMALSAVCFVGIKAIIKQTSRN